MSVSGLCYSVILIRRFKNTSDRIKQSVFNLNYTRSISKITTSVNRTKSFRFVSSKHPSTIILQYWWLAIKSYILTQLNQTASKSSYYITNYGRFTGNCWIEQLQNRKPISPIPSYRTIPRKRQATGFEPLSYVLSLQSIIIDRAWWFIGIFDAFHPNGLGFESRSSRHLETLAKSFTCSCLCASAWNSDTVSVLSGAPLSSSGLEEAL